MKEGPGDTFRDSEISVQMLKGTLVTGRLILFLPGEWQRSVLRGADTACSEGLCGVSALFWEVFDKCMDLKKN